MVHRHDPTPVVYAGWNINFYPDAVPGQKVNQLFPNVTSELKIQDASHLHEKPVI